jgi:hypothetical protein
MATRKKKEVVEQLEPTVVVGSHLTVTTYPNGKTELKWDDEALARDVREALEEYELSKMKPAVKAKIVTRKKKEKVNE